eukprot:GFUD01020081.1.p1 GENE.GFUD01020081.1~~GFUD01020081.1.p1  ORF type:complete len:136 (+),score=3.96 GFUD01020081.1:51-458(+)
MQLLHLVCLAIACGIACSCKCAKHWPGDDCLCEGSEGRVCHLGCGDCDDDGDCEGDLVCGTNNCREMHKNGRNGYRGVMAIEVIYRGNKVSSNVYYEYQGGDDCCYSRSSTKPNKTLDMQASCVKDAPWPPSQYH